MEGMGWLCVHCGTPVPDHGDKCPNCDMNPYACEEGELLNVSPHEFFQFVKTGRLEPPQKQ